MGRRYKQLDQRTRKKRKESADESLINRAKRRDLSAILVLANLSARTGDWRQEWAKSVLEEIGLKK